MPMASDFKLVIGNELFMRPVEVSASIRTQRGPGHPNLDIACRVLNVVTLSEGA